ncbi:helix-turn-helix domain-containing protein [Chryseobacterium camelliae]|uniref:helix-turn-helix domain-containing protein n=1 Tax=Chryseobacterium camelliae TaxID=1265445 RepID=UPI002863C691|nr:helix-turn-helix transcriptional regulator [Chryseobacterium camelliae]MDR6515291.1 transcriptional regulator with XRE-family HTH domain [Chryseobacterium camelliae]
MQKEKLRSIRKKKGYTQQQIAEVIATDVSNYCRKEGGDVKIIHEEWEKIANFLNVPVEEIYEEEEGDTIINNNNATFYDSPGAGSAQNTFNNHLSIEIIKNLQEYIGLLKEEVKRLKDNQN